MTRDYPASRVNQQRTIAITRLRGFCKFSCIVVLGFRIRFTPGFMLPPAPQARRSFHRPLINSARSTHEPGSTLRNKWRQVLPEQRARRLAINIARAGDHDRFVETHREFNDPAQHAEAYSPNLRTGWKHHSTNLRSRWQHKAQGGAQRNPG